ncbi:MAG: BatD family protein [Akkermansiaceae bacterium]|nr:BatD family protein [Akkermansiaceae bacterium]
MTTPASILFLALFMPLLAYAQDHPAPYAEAALTSDHLIPGEQTSLVIQLRGAQPDFRPAPPAVPNTAVNFVRSVTQIDTQRQLTQVFQYRLTSAKPGTYTIPPVAMSAGGKQLQSPPVTFHVHDPANLVSLPTGLSGHNILAGWFPAKTNLYQGEQCPLVLKLYVPEQLRLASWGLPDPKKENCLAWRFSMPPLHQLGQATVNGIPHLSASYETTLSGIKPGTATLGPTQLRLVIRQRTIDPRLGPRISDIPLELTLPPVKFTVLPFPEGAPAGFQGAVGQFQIRAECSKLTLNDTDTTEVILQVGGTGNLENIQPPQLTGSDWKVIDTSKITRGEERRFISGVVTYRQLLRPDLDPTPNTPSSIVSIPPYSFSYFDPDDKAYHTLTTTDIPVNIIPTAKPNGASTDQPEINEKVGSAPDDMRGILGFIDKPTAPRPAFTTRHSLFYHLFPALVCLIIVAIPIRRKIKAASASHPDDQKKKEALKNLSEPADTRTFYRRAGRFIDQWLHPNQELETILSERDKLCFLPDDIDVGDIAPDRKKEIIALLKRCSRITLILLSTILTTPDLPAQENHQSPITNHNSPITNHKSQITSARDAWKAGQYQQAIDIYQKEYPNPAETPADVLYNIGNCHYRLDQFGHAALAWRRALAVAPDHQKARQNLRYLELEQGAFSVNIATWQNYLTLTTPQVYKTLFYTSLWMLLIISLILILLRPRHKVPWIILLFLPPIAATLAALGVYYFPDSDFHTPFDAQAVSLKKSPLYTEAHRQEKDPGGIPEASYLKVVAVRGPWTNVETPDGQSGWVASENIGMVAPDSTQIE